MENCFKILQLKFNQKQTSCCIGLAMKISVSTVFEVFAQCLTRLALQCAGQALHRQPASVRHHRKNLSLSLSGQGEQQYATTSPGHENLSGPDYYH
jgi:hypothetical protein